MVDGIRRMTERDVRELTWALSTSHAEVSGIKGQQYERFGDAPTYSNDGAICRVLDGKTIKGSSKLRHVLDVRAELVASGERDAWIVVALAYGARRREDPHDEFTVCERHHLASGRFSIGDKQGPTMTHYPAVAAVARYTPSVRERAHAEAVGAERDRLLGCAYDEARTRQTSRLYACERVLDLAARLPAEPPLSAGAVERAAVEVLERATRKKRRDEEFLAAVRCEAVAMLEQAEAAYVTAREAVVRRPKPGREHASPSGSVPPPPASARRVVTDRGERVEVQANSAAW